MMPPRLRIALAPTANPTVNAARVALANALFAHRHGGTLTLRLDDLRADRVRPAFVDAIHHDLAWCGITWDAEHPLSDRLGACEAAITRLRATGRLYPCLESEAELKAKSERRRRQGKANVYDRAMLALTPDQLAAAIANGKRPHWRFRLSPGERQWHDPVLGPRSAKLTALSDPILVREDGGLAPVLVHTIDDLALGITHLIRGEENVADTATMLEIWQALDPAAAMPVVASIPALRDADARLGQRPVREPRADGVLPEALAAWMAGRTTPLPPVVDAGPAAWIAALADGFDWRAWRTPPDAAGLLRLNRAALAAQPFDAVADRLPAGAHEPFWLAIRGGIDMLRDADHWWDVVAGDITPDIDADAAPALRQALAALPASPWDSGTWDLWTTGMAQADRAGLYRALMGEEDGPEPASLLPLIGRERVIRRLTAVLA